MNSIKRIRRLAFSLAMACASMAHAQSDDAQQSLPRDLEQAAADAEAEDAAAEQKLVTPGGLSDALSCQSRDAATAFGNALFLREKNPEWMHAIKDEDLDKATQGMIGLYGYKLSKPVMLQDEPVDTVYFMKEWVIALMPRAEAEAFIKAQALTRAPIKMTEQYYRFVDPETGPMVGAFEPTGNSTGAMLAMAFGAQMPPSPPSDKLFVGCGYAPASEADFLKAAGSADAMMKGAAKDVSDVMDGKPKR